jgi:type I restriction enzyme, S subunit
MPEGWKRLKWGDVATLEYGKSLTNYKNSTGNIPVYGTN